MSRRLVHTVRPGGAGVLVEASGYADGRAFVVLGDRLLRPQEARDLASALLSAAGLSVSLAAELRAAGPTLHPVQAMDPTGLVVQETPIARRDFVQLVREAQERGDLEGALELSVEHLKAKRAELGITQHDTKTIG